VILRAETDSPEDRASIRHINEAAFGQPDEADLIDRLRAERAVLVSLIAEQNHPVGHILFSRMFIDTAAGSIPAVSLAPMAVLPENQRSGIGGRLIQRGLDLLHEQGERITIVVGHPDYYPRFGFSSEKAACLVSPFPREAFMAMELQAGALNGIRGAVRYAAAFRL
jgi:putative acetyltransferase